MRKQIYITIFFLNMFLGLCEYSYGWENKKTHPAITDKAVGVSSVDSYLKSQIGLDNGILAELYWDFPADMKERIKWGEAEPEKTTRTTLEWVRLGSIIEDEDGHRWPWRPRHHFHAPIANPGVTPPNPNSGLDNKTDHPNWSGFPTWSPFDLTGESTLVWAVQGIAPMEPTVNNESWQDARDSFYQSIILPEKSDREKFLAMTLLDLGCVLHMIEDLGVPAHARNDFLFGHYRNAIDNGNPFESWVEEKVAGNNWSGTGPVVFNKLAKYFDADVYAGGYLGNGISPPPGIWGLSECTNYQFMSTSTVFGCSGIKYQFPQPAKEHTTSLAEYGKIGDTVFQKIYFNGSNYGVLHLVRRSYTHYKKSIWGGDVAVVDSTNTPDDVNVFEDYADITIPRTIDYATGLVNYFFRGRLNVEPNQIDPNIVKLVITNNSNNSGVPQTIKGGTFEIYRDDTNDTRTKINPTGITFTPQWTPASTLPNDGGLTKLIAQFAPPAERVKKYIVVYKGSISENPADPDPNDPNAIAVDIVRCGYEIVAWAIDPAVGDKYGQVSNAPQGSHFIAIAAGKRHCLALESDGSIKAWGWDKYGQCSNTPTGNDFVAIAAGNYHSIALKSDGSIVVWGDDSLWQITDKPTGNDFVAITAGDYHSLALKSNGTIVGWGGYNDYGECDAPAPDTGTVYTAIAAGTYHSLALQSDGTVKAWGNNNLGQTRIYDGAASKVHIAVAACANYSFLLRNDQMIITWGNGDWLEPDIPRYHYRYYDGTDFVAIAAGWDHILALTSDGQILSWYWPNGDYPFDYFSRTVPEGIIFTDDIAAGYDFSLSLKSP